MALEVLLIEKWFDVIMIIGGRWGNLKSEIFLVCSGKI
jgi:hypothetical protein